MEQYWLPHETTSLATSTVPQERRAQSQTPSPKYTFSMCFSLRQAHLTSPSWQWKSFTIFLHMPSAHETCMCRSADLLKIHSLVPKGHPRGATYHARGTARRDHATGQRGHGHRRHRRHRRYGFLCINGNGTDEGEEDSRLHVEERCRILKEVVR